MILLLPPWKREPVSSTFQNTSFYTQAVSRAKACLGRENCVTSLLCAPCPTRAAVLGAYSSQEDHIRSTGRRLIIIIIVAGPCAAYGAVKSPAQQEVAPVPLNFSKALAGRQILYFFDAHDWCIVWGTSMCTSVIQPRPFLSLRGSSCGRRLKTIIPTESSSSCPWMLFFFP